MSASVNHLTESQTQKSDLVSQRAAVVALLVAAGYYITATIGFAFVLQPGSVSTLWMPNAILLSGLLLVPRRSWWLILLAASVPHFASEWQSGVPTLMVLSWFVSNSAQALIGALLVCHFIESQLRFDSYRDVVVFVVFGAILAPFVASFLDIALVQLNGSSSGPYWEIWRVRFFSNVLATLVLVPVIMSWASGGLTATRNAVLNHFVESCALVVGLLAVSFVVFRAHLEGQIETPWLLYLPLPFLLWAAVRFGPIGESTSLLIVVLVAISGAVQGHGPFVAHSSAENALSIQGFLIVVSLPLMVLAAVIEERKRAVEAVRRNEERLELALGAAHMGTWDWQISDNEATWSVITRRMFGTEESNPDLETFYKVIHPDDRAAVAEAISKAIEERIPYEAEFRVVMPEGTRWILGKGRVSQDESGRLRMLGVNIDRTEQKLAEEALRESEARLARTEDFSLVMVSHVGLDGRWLKVPRTLCELVGYSEAELVGRHFKTISHPDDVASHWRECERLIRGEIKSFDLEQRYLRKDGSVIWIYLSCSVVEDAAGKPIHFVTYARNTTDRKLAEQALIESNKRNQAILNALPDLMFLQTKEGVYLDYYARNSHDLLVSPEAFLGKNISDILPRELADQVMDAVHRLDSSVEPQILEYSLPVGGEERHYEARLVNADEDSVLSIVRDVTERSKAADALRLSQEQLIESSHKARALAARLITAQESERRRIALLLHDDLSQTIAALGVAISRLKRKPPASSEQLAAELDQLGKETNKLNTEIRRLSHQLHPDVLEHVGLVAALESEVAEFGHNEQIKVGFSAQVKSEQIPLDVSVCLYRVAIEALRNVSRHSGARSATVSLAEDDTCFSLEVSDSGHGFDVEKAKRGHGLGLISAQERVSLLQGDFLIRSKPNTGTVITARIPLVRL